MAWSIIASARASSLLISSSSSSLPSLSPSISPSSSSSHRTVTSLNFNTGSELPWISPLNNAPLSSSRQLVCRAAEYKFPDPIPEFADAETKKFREHLMKKLSKKDMYGDSLEEVVNICTEIFSTFLHTEYGGPGTLLVLPFIDMADTLNERGLPGGPKAARQQSSGLKTM